MDAWLSCIQGAYTPLVANLLTSEELEKLTRSTLDKLRRLAPVQRDVVVEQILRADPEIRPVIGDLLRIYSSAKCSARLGPLIRDSVG